MIIHTFHKDGVQVMEWVRLKICKIFQRKNLEGRDYVRDLGIDGRVLQSYMGSKDMDWIHLAQDRI